MTPQPRWMALSQGSYYFLTGLWPLLHRSSFLAVTGPKVDLWLVNTVGALLAVSGLVLLVAGWRDRCLLDVGLLALGNAGVLATVEVVYVLLGSISPIYLADAMVESVFIVLWLLCWRAWRYRL